VSVRVRLAPLDDEAVAIGDGHVITHIWLDHLSKDRMRLLIL
jgi:hypothetical protein